MREEIIVGDVLEALAAMPDKSVDTCVTSPPYNTLGRRIPASPGGIHKDNAFLKKINEIGYSDDMPEEEYQDWLRRVVEHLLRVCRGVVWINHKPRYRDGVAVLPQRFLPFPVHCEVIWDRGISLAMNCGRFAPSYEYVLGFGTPAYWNREVNKLMGVWRIPPRRDVGAEDHPCPFPLELASRLVKATCPPDGVVLDPFLGSGTTALAAKSLGVGYVGIEREPRYVEVAKKRLGIGETKV